MKQILKTYTSKLLKCFYYVVSLPEMPVLLLMGSATYIQFLIQVSARHLLLKGLQKLVKSIPLQSYRRKDEWGISWNCLLGRWNKESHLLLRLFIFGNFQVQKQLKETTIKLLHPASSSFHFNGAILVLGEE